MTIKQTLSAIKILSIYSALQSILNCLFIFARMGKTAHFKIYFKCTSTHSYKKLRKFGNEENLKIIKAQKESKVILSSEVIPALLISIEMTTLFSDNCLFLFK